MVAQDRNTRLVCTALLRSEPVYFGGHSHTHGVTFPQKINCAKRCASRRSDELSCCGYDAIPDDAKDKAVSSVLKARGPGRSGGLYCKEGLL